MKIALASDLHLEFADVALPNTVGADVLVLAGDIFVANDFTKFVPNDEYLVDPNSDKAKRARRYYDFFKRVSGDFKHVILIMGNHEHYHGDFATTERIIRGVVRDFPNIQFLEKQHTEIAGVLFFGGTLWTDFNSQDPVTMYMIRSMMNDFHVVRNSTHNVHGKFYPEDALAAHQAFLAELAAVLRANPDKPTVVVGHHAPSKLSVKPKYEREYTMNGAYSTDLSSVMLDNPQIKLWVHGHTHDVFDYMVGSTRVACNPRGYLGHEDRADEFELVVFDV